MDPDLGRVRTGSGMRRHADASRSDEGIGTRRRVAKRRFS
jgi:hypothetical protein